MQLTFNTFLHHVDEEGNSFLELELVLLSTPEKRFRMMLTIPSTNNKDIMASLKTYANPITFGDK